MGLADTNHTLIESEAELFSLLEEIKDEIVKMGDKADGLMSDEKNKVVGWWRTLPNVVYWRLSKSWAYALYLMIACLPFVSGTMPSLDQFFLCMDKKEEKVMKEICDEFPFLLYLTFRHILDTSVSVTLWLFRTDAWVVSELVSFRCDRLCREIVNLNDTR